MQSFKIFRGSTPALRGEEGRGGGDWEGTTLWGIDAPGSTERSDV